MLQVNPNFSYSRRRSRAILNELSGRYVQNKRPGRQKLLDKVYSSCENSNLPIYKPSQLEVGERKFQVWWFLTSVCFRMLSDVWLHIMEHFANVGTVSFSSVFSMSQQSCLTMQLSSSELASYFRFYKCRWLSLQRFWNHLPTIKNWNFRHYRWHNWGHIYSW